MLISFAFFHPNVKQPLGEDTAQVRLLVVLLQRVRASSRDLGRPPILAFFFLRQVKQVEVVGTPAVGFGIDFVLGSIRPAIKMAAKA